ncbi:hypothetical protein JYT22_01100 [Endomicrobium sp. AH-315-J14]|nr:hypothetical protein [Endomicrobium sp. AH-315-J14]
MSIDPRYIRRRWATVAHVVMAVLLSGCLFGAAGSKLEDGKSVRVGKRKFDTYFAAVAELRDQAKEIDGDLFTVREPLWEELDVDVNVPVVELMDITRKRVGKYRDYGLIMNLRLTPSPRVITVEGTMDLDERDRVLLATVETTAARAMSLYSQVSDLLLVAVQLESQRGPVAELIDRLSPRDPKRDEIELEIVAAGRVIKESRRKLSILGARLAFFLVELIRAVDTGASDTLEEQCEQLKLDAAERKTRPRPPPRRPSGRPRPKRPSGGGDDFDL